MSAFTVLCLYCNNCDYRLYQNQACVITVPLLWLAAESLGRSVSATLARLPDSFQCPFHELPRRKSEQSRLLLAHPGTSQRLLPRQRHVNVMQTGSSTAVNISLSVNGCNHWLLQLNELLIAIVRRDVAGAARVDYISHSNSTKCQSSVPERQIEG